MEIFVGWDSREPQTYATCVASIDAYTDIPCFPIKQHVVRAGGLYTRPQDKLAATEFSLTRFLVPFIASKGCKWALFCDGDFIFTRDVQELFDQADPKKTIQVVKHDHTVKEAVKMDGQTQHMYPRKWWSALMLWNLEHSGNKQLTLDMVNTAPPSVLHRFGWLKDKEIGEISPEWHWLDGYDQPMVIYPSGVHYTLGTPELGNDNIQYRQLWDSFSYARGKE